MEKNKKRESSHPKYTANIFSKLFLCWLMPLVWYARNHRLSTKDFHEVLSENRSKPLTDKLQQLWEEEANNARKNKRQPKLWKAIWRLFGCDFFKYAIHAFIRNIAIQLWRPIAVSKVISYFDPKSTMTQSEAYGYAVTIMIATSLDGIVKDYTTYGLKNIGVRMRIACSSLVYRKLLKLSDSSAKQITIGQLINLLSNDVVRLEYSLLDLHYLWTTPILTLAICYISWNAIGGPGLIGISLLILQAIPLAMSTYFHINLRRKIAKRTDKRLLLLNESIRGIRILKMFTWEKPFVHLVRLARRKEIHVITIQNYIKQISPTVFTFIHQLCVLITAAVLKLQGARINPSQIYPLFLYINTLRSQYIFSLGHAFRYSAESIAALVRIQEFLLLEELVPISTQSNLAQHEEMVLIKNASAGFNSKENIHVLRDVNLEILPGKSYAIVGPIGSGKSSLLKLILGELKATTGNVFIKGDISFASQEPWLFNASIKNNILFDKPYDNEKYKKVISACALLKDFTQLPHGDKMVVGEHGSLISGGQRVRINLARALYRDADIYLLDDPLDAVDIVVRNHLFENCVNGLLKNKTRILVTHQLQYFKEADEIIIMDNGHIAYQGDFDNLKKHDQFSKYLVTNDTTNDLIVGSSVYSEMSVSSNITDELDEEAEEEFNESNRLVPKKCPTKTRNQSSKESINRELTGIDNSKRSVYKSYIKAVGVYKLILVITTIFGIYGLGNVFDYTFSKWIKYESEAYNMNLNSTLLSNMETKLSFFYSLYVLEILMITIIVLSVVEMVLYIKFSMNASMVIHDKMLSCLFNAPITFFDSNDSGEILNRFSKDLGMVDSYIPSLTIEPLAMIIFVPLTFIQMMINNKLLIILFVIVSCMFYIVIHIFLNILRQSRRLEGHIKSMVYSHASTSLCGVLTIRSCKGESLACKEFDVKQDHHTAAYSTYLDSLLAFFLWIDVIQTFFISAVPFLFLILKDTGIAGATVGLVISHMHMLTSKTMRCAKSFTELDANMISTERLLNYTKIKPEIKNVNSTGNHIPNSWPTDGEIKFDRVYLKYSDSAAATLKNLNFTIKSQSKVGVVGRTGAGKSSLITALFRLAETKGSIFIDGVDTTKIDLQQLRKKISILPQEPILFSVSVRKNLDPLDEFDDSSIWSVLCEFELNKEFRSLDEILDQNNLSYGKRQLLCLARAMLNKNKILILDEVTANVDEHAEALIQKCIRDKFKDCTILTIAHRLHTIMDSDKVLVIDNGEVVEYDHPHLLLQDKNSHLSKMIQQADICTANGFRRIVKEAFESKLTQLSSEDE